MTRTLSTKVSDGLPIATQVGLIAGPFLSSVDSNIVTVALPVIANQLHTTLQAAQWILSAYLLALAAGLAASAFLAKRFGTRRVYLISLVGFTASSALCAFTPDISLLIAARVVQGLLGAPLIPLALNMLLSKQGGKRRRLPPAAGMMLFLAPAIGPAAGGLLLHVGGWPLIFLVNVPIGILGMLGVISMPRTAGPPRTAAPFDPLGIVLLAAGLVLVLLGATQGPDQGWLTITVWPLLLGGAFLLALYVVWALRHPHPAVDLKLLRHSQSALAIGLSVLTAVVLFSMLFLAPLYMEEIQQLSALIAGVVLLPQALVTGLGTVVGHRLPTRLSALLGMIILTASTALLLVVNITTPAWAIALILCGRGFALGMVIQPLLHAAIDRLGPTEVADGNTLFNVAQRLGASVGIALLSTFFLVREQVRTSAVLQASGFAPNTSVTSLPASIRAKLGEAAVAGFHDTIWLLIALSACGILIALLLRDVPRSSTHKGAQSGDKDSPPDSKDAQSVGKDAQVHQKLQEDSRDCQPISENPQIVSGYSQIEEIGSGK
ncbi:DHA2 family efflux MFS transporter permease subunit [Ktedonosporobacter rubrisoli]|uniref:DHA2 family efflux MFS transporter permease subunit n=1 Tax=Ktedonosporobacter rubrisoli TaxID=2509675 RepID=A0A4P6K5X8_KTERU|nr:DHA2 family efflux MFS transporter permease subunit [Ktedonosporobacter rubrisoli]QBD83300.1 DHA2 family efflux MFS transporter permease subunit [Ktedonosporobacter rubrisoli]